MLVGLLSAAVDIGSSLRHGALIRKPSREIWEAFFSLMPMEFAVYILYSKKYSKTYVGYTSDLISRFHSHNSLAIKGWTLKFRPWEVIHVEFFSSKTEAMKREKELKSGKGRDFIKSITTPI